MMLPGRACLNYNRSFCTLWARCFEGGSIVMNPTVCVHMGLMASACGAAWGGATECA